MGMAIVAGLLSPSGPQTTPRAEAGVTFIYLFMGTSLFEFEPFLLSTNCCRPIFSFFLFGLDASAG